MSTIALRGVRKSFGARVVLDGLDLQVEAGEVYGLLGPNGSGKSTAINILCGLLQADAGEVRVDLPADRMRGIGGLGVCPQETALYPDLDARENLDFFARLHGLRAGERRIGIERVMAELGLARHAATPVRALSGGLQRRVNIGVALVQEPRILVLDEPTAGLDVEARQELWRVLDALRHRGMTILLCTHHLDEAEHLCSHVGILQDGRIVRAGTVAQLVALVPAHAILLVDTPQEPALAARAGALGWGLRRSAGRVACLLPESTGLHDAVDLLRGIDVRSISLQGVSLEYAYLEVLHAGSFVPAAAAAAPAPRPLETVA